MIKTNFQKDERVFILRFRRERASNNPERDRWHVNVRDVHADEWREVVGIENAFSLVRARLASQENGNRGRLA